MQDVAAWVVADRYEVGEVVGRGGFGMVRRGLDRKTGAPVALKMLSPEAGNDPQVVERMLREQQAMVALTGTCAVTAIDLFRLQSGAPCLVMEWLEGKDLERQLSDWEIENHRPPIATLIQILRPLTETLQRAHEIGVVHRDIKPANVFLTTQSGVRLLDFGLSRMRSAATLTAAGMVMGSPSYIPPETWGGNSSLVDHRADLYSLAVIVFRALTGQVPFATRSLVEKLELVTTAPRPSVCALRPDLPPSTDDWMKRALAIEPQHRFQTAREFYEALLLALSGLPLPSSDADISGIRLRAPEPTLESVASDPHETAETRNMLSLAWQKATTLLRRFTAPRNSEPSAAVSAPEPSSGAEKTPRKKPEPPRGARTPAAAAAPAANEPSLDRLSVAWLDESDLEDAAPDSAGTPSKPLAAEPSASDVALPEPTKPAVKKRASKTPRASRKPAAKKTSTMSSKAAKTPKKKTAKRGKSSKKKR